MKQKITKLLLAVIFALLFVATYALSACGEGKIEEATDLEYELGYGLTYYTVSGIGKETRTEFAIPAEHEGLPVQAIKDNAFKDCKNLVSVVIPHGITNIYENTFSGCSNLASVTLPDTIEYIGRFAFKNCESLKNINIPSSVTTIGYETFGNCTDLTSIVIPSSVTTVNNCAFHGCSSLTIYCEAASQPETWGVDWNESDCPVVWGYVAEN